MKNINLLEKDLLLKKEELVDFMRWVYEIPHKYGVEIENFLISVASRRQQEATKPIEIEEVTEVTKN